MYQKKENKTSSFLDTIIYTKLCLLYTSDAADE